MDVKSLYSSSSIDVLKPRQEEVKTVNEAVQDKLKEQQDQIEVKKVNGITKEDLEKNITGVNNFLETNYTSLKFQVHEDLDRLFVEVVDKNTQEVVREIPPRQFLDMISSMLEFVGLIVDKRV